MEKASQCDFVELLANETEAQAKGRRQFPEGRKAKSVAVSRLRHYFVLFAIVIFIWASGRGDHCKEGVAGSHEEQFARNAGRVQRFPCGTYAGCTGTTEALKCQEKGYPEAGTFETGQADQNQEVGMLQERHGETPENGAGTIREGLARSGSGHCSCSQGIRKDRARLARGRKGGPGSHVRKSRRPGVTEFAQRGQGRKQKKSGTDSNAPEPVANLHAAGKQSSRASTGRQSAPSYIPSRCQDTKYSRGAGKSQSGQEGENGSCGADGKETERDRSRKESKKGVSRKFGLVQDENCEGDLRKPGENTGHPGNILCDMRERCTGAAITWHFAYKWPPSKLLDAWNVRCTAKATSDLSHNGWIYDAGTGLRRLLSHISLRSEGYVTHTGDEMSAHREWRYLNLQNVPSCFSCFAEAGIERIAETAKRSWLFIQKNFPCFGSMSKDFGLLSFTFGFDSNLIVAIVAIIFRDAIGLPLGPTTENAVFSFALSDACYIHKHGLEEVAAEQFFLLRWWFIDHKPDFDPRIVKHMILFTIAWGCAFAAFFLCLICAEIKKRIHRRWYCRPGTSRFCGKRRVSPCRISHTPNHIRRLIVFGWLLASPHAIEPLRNYCAIDQVSNISRLRNANQRDGYGSTFTHQGSSQTTSSDDVQAAESPPGTRLSTNPDKNWSEIWFDFCASTEDPICTVTGSVACFDDPDANATPSNCESRMGHDIANEVETTNQFEDLPGDDAWLMQLPTFGRGETCGRHIDATIYWDRLAHRSPIINTRFYVWKTNPSLIGVLQQQIVNVPWDGRTCTRCAIAAFPAFAETDLMCGPYYLRPQPAPFDGTPALQFILVTWPKLVMQKAIHLKIQTSSGVRQGTMVLNTLGGVLGMPLLFDLALPENRCRTTSWCRAQWQSPGYLRVWWWPSNLYLEDFIHIQLDEFDTQPGNAPPFVALPPNQAFTCQHSNTDPGSTSYEEEQTSLITFRTRHMQEDDSSSLMHMPNPAADRSRSDTSAETESPASDSMRTVVQTRAAEDDVSDEEFAALLVFGRHIEPELVPITDNSVSVDMHRSIAARHFSLIQGSEEWDSFSIYSVRPRPEDLAPSIIPILATFQGEKTMDSSIVLIDIELRTNRPQECEAFRDDPYILRESWFLPVTLTRAAFIHFIGLKELCKQIALPCITQYGYHGWFQQDAIAMPIPDGLFLRVIVPIPEPDLPMPFYVEYSRANIPFERMLEHFQQQQRQAARRLAELFPTDDEAVAEAVNTAPAAPLPEDDLNSLFQAPRKDFATLIPNASWRDFDDESSLMMLHQAPETGLVTRQILVIYEFDFPPTTATIDPTLPIGRLRHAVGTLTEITDAFEWDNFLLMPVRPRPPHIDPLTHESYLLIMPQHIRQGHAHLVVRLQLFWEYADCYRTDEHSEVKVIIFPQWLDRESFLVNSHFKDLCMSTGTDRSVVQIGGKLWHTEDLESRYIFDGMFASIRCPTRIRDITLREQISSARERGYSQSHANLPIVDSQRAFSLIQIRASLQPFRSPDAGLSPPGNGKLDSLDKVVSDQNGECTTIDWIDLEEIRPICLAELLPIPTPLGRRFVPTTHNGFPIPEEMHQGKPKPDHQSVPNELFCSHQFGSLSTLYDDLLAFDAVNEELDKQAPPDFECPDEILKWKETLKPVVWQTWDPFDAEEFRFYTDGSFDGKVSSWAFCCVVCTKEEWKFVGYQCGLTVPFQRMHRTHSALVGELQALLWAGSWMLRLARFVSWTGHVTFCWDSTVAGHKADGDFIASKDFLSEVVRHIFQGLEALLGHDAITHKHVRAHTGVCPNEYVDSLAKHALKHNVLAPTHSHAFQTFIDQPNASLQWLWWHIQCEIDPKSDHEVLPRYRDGRIQWEPRANCFVDAEKVVRTSMMQTHELPSLDAVCLHYTLQIGTYNCLSLGTDDCAQNSSGLQGLGRVALVRHAASRLGFNLLGIQEARSKCGTVRSQTHLRICSGRNDDGTLGTELWVALDQPFCTDAKGHPVHFKPHEFAVMIATPRLLIVACQTKHFEAYFVVGHAPHTGTSEEVRHQWWQQLAAHLSRLKDHDIVCMLDAKELLRPKMHTLEIWQMAQLITQQKIFVRLLVSLIYLRLPRSVICTRDHVLHGYIPHTKRPPELTTYYCQIGGSALKSGRGLSLNYIADTLLSITFALLFSLIGTHGL